MPLYMDIHRNTKGATEKQVADAHFKDLQTQTKYGVNYRHYYLDEKDGTLFCLVEAPDKESAIKVHREAHGIMADDIFEVTEH